MSCQFQHYGPSCGCDPNLSQHGYEGFEPFHTVYSSNVHQSYGDDANYHPNAYHFFGDGASSYGYPSFGQDFDCSAQSPYSSHGHSYGYPQQHEPYASPYPASPGQYAQQYSCSYQDFDSFGDGCYTNDMSSTGYYLPSYYEYLWPPVMVETVENVEEFTMKRETRPMTGAKTRGPRKRSGGRRGREYYGSYGMGGCDMM
ncbi:hypothetical protein VE03_06958 [Pseudogymnoascus sp. 23342-1-I1]|nr:hypothetical protein VE03_06958 [Pseudogymnoascus sp. 23342-1-I1]